MSKINGISLGELVRLERDIKLNFGSLYVFSKKTRISYTRILRMFGKSEFTRGGFREVKTVYNFSMEDRKGDDIPGRISDRARRLIRIKILTKFYNYTEFCKEHPEYDVVYITNVVRGNLKLASDKYNGLVSLLTNKYNLKLKTYENN